jgi:hypothetical protein
MLNIIRRWYPKMKCACQNPQSLELNERAYISVVGGYNICRRISGVAEKLW